MGSFYKADRHIRYEEDYILHDFIDGYHRVWDETEKTVHREPLAKYRQSKYNKTFINHCNTIIGNFAHLITIESTLVQLINIYANTWEIGVGNLWRMINAQAGTIRYYRSLKIALRTYPVMHQNVYNALKMSISKANERFERNSKFIDVFMEGLYLKPVVDLVHEVLGETMYENVERVSKEYLCNNDLSLLDGKKKSEELSGAYAEYIIKFTEDHGIDIGELINDGKQKHQKYRTSITQRIANNKINMKHIGSMETLKNINDIKHAELYDALNNGNHNGSVSIYAYTRLIEEFEKVDKLWYIAICKRPDGKMVYYTEGKPTGSLTAASMTVFYDEGSANRVVENLMKENPVWACEVCSLEYHMSVGNVENKTHFLNQFNTARFIIKRTICEACRKNNLYMTDKKYHRVRFNIDASIEATGHAYMIFGMRQDRQLYVGGINGSMNEIDALYGAHQIPEVSIYASRELAMNQIRKIRSYHDEELENVSFVIEEIKLDCDGYNAYQESLKNADEMIKAYEESMAVDYTGMTVPKHVKYLRGVFHKHNVDTIYVPICISKESYKAKFITFFEDYEHQQIDDGYIDIIPTIIGQSNTVKGTLYSIKKTGKQSATALVTTMNILNDEHDLEYIVRPITYKNPAST